MINTKVPSAHFIFEESVTYADFVPIYPELFRKFLEVSKQLPEDETLVDIWIERDMKELKKGKKPEGFLKQNAIKMVFPVRDDRVEFYIYMKVKNEEIPIIADKLKKTLKKARLKYEIEYDKMLRFANAK